MKKIIISALIVLSGTFFFSCDDGFLDREPVTDLSEANAFLTYSTYQDYMWKCYAMFSDKSIVTSTNTTGTESCYRGDFWAGYLGRTGSQNQYSIKTVTPSTDGNGWNFEYIRRVNIMLSHLNDGVLTADEADHWRAVGYLFHSFWYMELIDRFNDVPWVDIVLTDETPENLGPRMPRKEVADKVLERLIWAEANIDKKSDGDNTVNGDVVRAVISRFALREATWRKYHGSGDTDKYFTACASYSEKLMSKYTTLYKGVDKNAAGNPVPAAGYGELWTTSSLKGIPGIILYKELAYPLTSSRFSDYEHIAAHDVEMPKHTIDMYLCKDGKTISNSSLYAGDKDPYATFRNRDPRLYHVIQPPFKVLSGKGTDADLTAPYLPSDGNWHYVTPAADDPGREYIDIMGINNAQGSSRPGGGDQAQGMKRLPTQNWGNSPLNESPHFIGFGVAFQACRTGYYVWKFYANWEENGNKPTSKSDFPIFKIEEVLLNYAECLYEQGKFTQEIANRTINLLRARAGVADMTVAEINDSFDPNRGTDDSGTKIDPVLWEIRRERMIELMGEGFGFYDVRRWKCAKWYINRQQYGMWTSDATYLASFQVIDAPGATPRKDGTPGYIYRYADPVASGLGWIDQYYLYCVPTNEIILNPNLAPNNPGWPTPTN